jgi:IclR family pca regulon transcriptional regulator
MKEIAKVRSNGYSIVDRELEYGLRSIAVPILSSSKRIVAAINVATSSQSNTLESMKKNILVELKDTASKISEDLAAVRQFSTDAPVLHKGLAR